jgi:hypothetical protein
LTWSLVNTSAWLQVSSTAGTLAAGSATAISAGLTTAAYSLAPGNYNASLLVSNQGGGAFTFPAALKIGQSLVQNGGFETGDFTGWTLVGNTTGSGNIYNAVESSSSGYSVVHSGSYGAFLGDTQVATLSQALSTVPGQYYLLSLWFDNPTSGTVQQFILDWNTNGAANNPLFSMVNPPAFSWTNLQFLVCATGTNATLKIQAENDPSYFGLDDVSVTPIPSPAFKTSAKSAGSFQLSWTTTTGLTYQVQYKTNLLQTAWVNLSNPFVATNYSSIFLDTNALGFSPQRFYRLIVSP